MGKREGRNLKKDVPNDGFAKQGKNGICPSGWQRSNAVPFLSLVIIICHSTYCSCGSSKLDDLIDIFNL